jgi:phosphomannomutase
MIKNNMTPIEKEYYIHDTLERLESILDYNLCTPYDLVEGMSEELVEELLGALKAKVQDEGLSEDLDFENGDSW